MIPKIFTNTMSQSDPDRRATPSTQSAPETAEDANEARSRKTPMELASAAQDLLLSDEEHAYARVLSEVLARFDALIPRHLEATKRMKSQDFEQHRSGAAAGGFNHLAFLKMSLREHDVTTLMSVVVRNDTGLNFTIAVKEPCRTPRDDYHPLAQLMTLLSDMGSKSRGWPLSAHHDPGAILDFVLDRWCYLRAHHITTVPYAEHAECLLRLLKQCHVAETLPDYELASGDLRLYVLVNSCGRMLRRVEYGVHGRKSREEEADGKRWLFDILTKPIEQSERQRQILMCFFGTQKLTIHDQVRVRLWSIYDAEGRQLFHQMLSKRLFEVRRTLVELQSTINALQATPYGGNQPAMFRNQIKMAVFVLYEQIRGLSEIYLNFEQILYVHLQWLSQVTGVGKAQDEPNFSKTCNSHVRPGSPTPPHHKPDAKSGENKEIPQHSTLVEDGVHPPSKYPQNAQLAGIAVNDEEQEIDTEDNESVPPGHAAPDCDKWARVALRYFLLIADHDLRILRAVDMDPTDKTAEEEEQSQMVLDAQLDVITVRERRPERKKLPVQACLDKLVSQSSRLRPGGEETPLNYIRLEKILTGRTAGSSKPKAHLLRLRMPWLFDISAPELFAPTSPHCESSAMGLAACLADDGLRKVITDVYESTPTDPQTFAARFAQLAHLQTSLPPVQYPAIERCCRACWIMVSVVNQEQGGRTTINPSVAPGHHTVWEEIELPAWTPKRHGREIIRRMEEEAFEILGRVQAEY